MCIKFLQIKGFYGVGVLCDVHLDSPLVSSRLLNSALFKQPLSNRMTVNLAKHRSRPAVWAVTSTAVASVREPTPALTSVRRALFDGLSKHR